MPGSNIRRALAALALLLIPPMAVRPAHATPGDAVPLTGTVVDSAGTPLAEATVSIGSLSRTVTTAGDGSFAFRALPAGTYHLDVSLLGYAPAHVQATLPVTGPAQPVRIVLRPSALALQGLVVTGTPGASDPLRVTQSVTQLSGKQLDRNVGSTVAQTLAQEPGIATRYNGPAASTPVIRGLSGDRVLVLQDGQRTGDLSGAAPDHGLSIDPLAATRLEVVRGPASLLYGSGAVGGVVNVIENDIPTSVPNHVDGYAALQGESVNPGGAGTAQVTLPLGGSLALTARGGGRRVDDVRTGGGDVLDNTWLHNYHGDVGLGYVGERVSAGAAYNGYVFSYGLPTPPGDSEAGVHIKGRRHEGKGRIVLPLGSGWLSDVRLEGTGQWYAHDEVESSGETGTSFNLKSQTANLQGRTRFGPVNGAIGVSGLFRQYRATGEEALTPAANSDNVGVFLFQEIPLGASEEMSPRLQLGGRYDHYRIASQDGGDRFGPGRTTSLDAFSGSAGLNVPLVRGTTLGASVSRAFRAPTVEELFSNAFHAATFNVEVGNAELKPEINNGIEALLRSQTGRVSGEITAYYNRINGFITPVVRDSVDVEGEDGGSVRVGRAVYEQADANLRGVEGRAEVAVARHFVVGGMGDYVRGTFVDGGNLPFMPPARLGGLLRFDDGRVSAEANVRHAFAQNDVPANEATTGAYDLMNVSLGYSRTAMGHIHTITLRADNLFDEQYRDATSRIKDFTFNPGRNVSLVYKVYF